MPLLSDRNFAMLQMKDANMTLEQIGQHFNITKERVRQIVGHGSRPRRYEGKRLFTDRDARIEWLWEYRKEWERAERFWAKADMTGECWEWKRGKHANGYGHIGGFQDHDNHGGYAHRMAWLLWHGSLPASGRQVIILQVLHACDNPGCIRPDHLFLGTVADNMHDRDAKGRGRDRTPHTTPFYKQHGTKGCYDRGGCRCDACRAAVAEYSRKRRAAVPKS